MPVGGLGDLGHGRALGAAQEVQDDTLFPSVARFRGFGVGRLKEQTRGIC
jgi:hypothetical protein